jgi:hypothetical protein
MAQTVMNAGPAAGFAGMLADTDMGKRAESFAAAVAVPLGVGVCKAGSDTQCKLPTSAGEAAKLFGVAIHSHVEGGANGSDDYPIGAMVPVLSRGVAWVKVEAAVVKGDPVYVRHTADGILTQLGGWSNAAGTGLALVAGAKFISSAAGGGLAQLQVNLP